MFIGQGGPLSFTINWPAIISMKIINCNNWAPRNKLNILISITDLPADLHGLSICYEGMWLITYIPELDRFYGSINLFHHRLEDVLYNILNKGGYFNEMD